MLITIVTVACVLVYIIGVGVVFGLAKPNDRAEPEVTLPAIFWPLFLVYLPFHLLGWLGMRGTERALAWWRKPKPKPEREPLPRTPAKPYNKAPKTEEPFR